MLESLDETLWQLFKRTGKTNYYLMYKAVKNDEEVEDGEVHSDMS